MRLAPLSHKAMEDFQEDCKVLLMDVIDQKLKFEKEET